MSKEKVSNGITKILVSFPNETIEKVSLLAKENGMSRSAMINYALKWYLDYKNSMDMLPVLMDLAKMQPKKAIEKKLNTLNNQ